MFSLFDSFFLTSTGVILCLSTGQCIAGQICRSRVTWHHASQLYTPSHGVFFLSCSYRGWLSTNACARSTGTGFQLAELQIRNLWYLESPWYPSPTYHIGYRWMNIIWLQPKREWKRFNMWCCAVRFCWDLQEEPEDIEVILQKARWPCCALSIVVVALTASPKTCAGWFGRLQRRLPWAEVLLASKLDCKTLRIESIRTKNFMPVL